MKTLYEALWNRAVVAALLLLAAPKTNAQELLWLWDGEAAGDHFGESVACAGDVNGDGVSDLIASSDNNNTSGKEAGMVRVFSGKDGSILYTFYGEKEAGLFGQAVTGFADFDGDGYSDFLISALDSIIPYDSAGKVWLYSGADGSLLMDWSGNPDDRLGYNLSELGDADGDGLLDIAFGAPAIGDNTPFVAVYSGMGGSLLQRIDPPGFSIVFGLYVSDIGDLDGDGLADLLTSNGRTVYAYSVIRNELLFSFEFAANEYMTWDPLAGLGDVNFDGIPDFIVGTHFENSQHDDVGKIWLYSGADATLIRSHEGPGELLPFWGGVGEIGDLNGDGSAEYLFGTYEDVFLISGRTGLVLYEYDELNPLDGRDGIGFSFDLAGDINGDGLSDFITGAPFRDGTGDGAGGVYVFSTNDFFLYAKPRDPTAGDLVVLDCGEDAPGQPAALFLMAINGAPTVVLIRVGVLDADGRLRISGNIPGLPRGTELTFQSFVLSSAGRVRDSGKESIVTR